MPAPRDPATLMMLVLTVAMAVAVASVVYLVTSDTDLTLDQVQPLATAAAPTCDLSRPATATCPAGQYCRLNACVPVPIEVLCAEGDSCRDCECGDGLVCHNLRCASPESIDRTPLVCEKNEALADAVKTLAVKCSTRKTTVADIVSAGACTTAEWEQLALEDDKFDLLLSAFPDRFAVHFPSGQPNLKRKDWPAQEVLAHYLDQVRRFAGPLREAKQIFVIGRASPDGDAEANHWLSLARIKFVENLLDLVLYEGVPETERDRRRVRIRSFGLPNTRTIEPARYRQTYLMDPGGRPPAISPLVTADPTSAQELRAALEGAIDLDDRTTPAWQALFSAVNRVVFVIPIPCLGDEYKPPISVDLEEPAP
ncbi:hypothetical protein [Nannocystis bainbridge]|uniref:OmpA family protein n=1 Tax=Nannocystis bainbridge TaxID=2995303 RepID=A0ABT5DY91_9BACT|nr:hypothetical protein [Nannocystis bainbridge]MDC0718115.1 hypothetical protein [Nannocystis bainbridge]